MKYLLSWLEDYYKTDESVSQIADSLTTLGCEVESVEGALIDENIIAVKITKIEPHPNADRLKIPTVFDGEKEIKIVCGGSNIEVGQIVPLAKVGSQISGEKIAEVEIRGVKSSGMLCSERELGLSDNHDGIKILPCEIVLGTKIRDIFSAQTVFDIEITPNRGDLLSHFGLARELCAKRGENLQKQEVVLKESEDEAQKEISVDLKTDLCPLYLARVIKGVKIAPSPKWLIDRLTKLGAKPINNVVDATNYAMLDLGHPLHAFDKKKLSGSKIVVRQLEENQEALTLDGEARALTSGMTVICDSDKPIAIAGVMGLKNSQIDEQTVDIVLEAAVFERRSIRKTRRLLAIQTEASYRFERGVGEGGVEYALDKTASLIQELSGGEILKGIVKAGKIRTKTKIKFEAEKINSLLGVKIEKDEMERILKALGFEIAGDFVDVPLWRNDVSIWQDIAEEVGRIYSLEKIAQKEIEVCQINDNSDYFKREKIKDLLVEMGFDETMTYTFLSRKEVEAAKLDIKGLVEVSNPIQEENRYLRNSLIPGLLKVVAANPTFDDIEIFEIGKIFDITGEVNSLSIATAGKSSRKIKDVIKQLCEKLKINESAFDVRELSHEDLSGFKIKKPLVGTAQINLDKYLMDINFDKKIDLAHQSKKTYKPISKYPSVKRDLAIVVKDEIESEQIISKIKQSSDKAVLVELFDEFSSSKLGEKIKSVAFHIYLEDENKTLQDKEAQEEMEKIIGALETDFDAKLRW